MVKKRTKPKCKQRPEHFNVLICYESMAETINAAARGLQLPGFLPTEKPNKDGLGCLHTHTLPGGVIISTRLRLAARNSGIVVLVH